MGIVKFADPTQDATFTETRGVLECDQCNLRYCGHIQEVLRTALDAQTIWIENLTVDPDDKMLDPTGMEIMVPLFPDQNVYAWVKITENLGGSWVVEICDQELKDEFLGMLTVGEGRSVLRRMVYAWLAERFDCTGPMTVDQAPRCKAASHNKPSRMRQFAEHLHSNPRLRLAELYCLLTTDMCVSCQHGIGGPDPKADTDFGDLVPEKP